MKTIRPIEIKATAKSKLIDIAKHAVNNAIINCSIVRLVVGGVDCLVYPQDKISTIIHYVKLQSVLLRLKELEAV